jgi:hypothetical protein
MTDHTHKPFDISRKPAFAARSFKTRALAIVMMTGALAAQASPAPDAPEAAVAVPYTVDRESHVSLALYDGSGRMVRSLLHGQPRLPGKYVEPWDGRDRYGRALPAGRTVDLAATIGGFA